VIGWPRGKAAHDTTSVRRLLSSAMCCMTVGYPVMGQRTKTLSMSPARANRKVRPRNSSIPAPTRSVIPQKPSIVYFVTRRLYPNVDFYSGLVYQAMGLPVDMFPVLFAIPRTAGWLAQWLEMMADPEQKIARPRQLYLGAPRRDYVPVDRRG
jgi:hypothetical protein